MNKTLMMLAVCALAGVTVQTLLPVSEQTKLNRLAKEYDVSTPAGDTVAAFAELQDKKIEYAPAGFGKSFKECVTAFSEMDTKGNTVGVTCLRLSDNKRLHFIRKPDGVKLG